MGRRSVKPVIIADKVATQQDVGIAARLLAAYQAASQSASQSQPEPGRNDVWTMITARQQHFSSLLELGNPNELATYLCNVSRHDASVGITQGDQEFHRILSRRSYRKYLAQMANDKLVSLAEAIGALPVENPEQGSFGRNVRRKPSELVELIAACVGTDIAPPDIDGGLLKIEAGGGFFGERDANAIYTAHLLRQTACRLGASHICEIGGGSGRVAYWSRRFGLTSYTLIDLPHVNVVQGYYALKSLHSDEVSLYGEHSAETLDGRLRILPAHVIKEVCDPDFDLFLNQDSFPEMSTATVIEYLEWIKRSGGSLMSINHESKPPYGDGLAHVSVPELIKDLGGFESTYRFPYWLRRGYVVELQRVTP